MSEIHFSIVTVVKNDLYGLLRTRASLENQSYQNWTHIVVDGLSHDGTREYIKTFPPENSVVTSESDSGIYQAMNKSLLMVPVKSYVIFLNARDVLVDNRALCEAAKALEANGFPLWGCTTHEEISESGAGWICKLVSVPSIPNQLYAFGYRSHQAVVMKASFLKDLGGFDERFKYAADWDLIAKALSKSLPCTWKYPLARFELGGFSSQNLLNAHMELREIRKSHLIKNLRQRFLDDLWCSLYLFHFGYTNKLTPIVNLLIGRDSIEKKNASKKRRLFLDQYWGLLKFREIDHLWNFSKPYKLWIRSFNLFRFYKFRFRAQLNLYFILYLHNKLRINEYEVNESYPGDK
jgi:glycosyltransferase involved in cell wall biosynthesis